MADAPEMPLSVARKLAPNRVSLAELERLLTRLQFECEEIGWWPGVPAHPVLPHYTPAPGLLSDLYWEYMLLLKQDPWLLEDLKEKPWLDFTDCIYVTGWDPQWVFEVKRLMKSLGTVICSLITYWQEKLGDIVSLGKYDADGEEWYFPETSYHLTRELASDESLVIPPNHAAALERCRRRLRVLLENGTAEVFGADFASEGTGTEQSIDRSPSASQVPTAAQRKRPGRPHNPDKAALAAASKELASQGLSWKGVPAQIEKMFGRKYAVSTLKSYVKDAARNDANGG